MPQNNHMELYQKRYGKRFDHEERQRKKVARSVNDISDKA
jgi:ribosome biogenesis protein NSA2